METSKAIEKQQNRLKRRRAAWLRWLCNRHVLRALINVGTGIYLLVRTIRELMTVFRN